MHRSRFADPDRASRWRGRLVCLCLLAGSTLAQAGAGGGAAASAAASATRSAATSPDRRALATCQRMPAAEQWLAKASQRWRQQLQEQAGYEPLPQVPQVCALQYGNPFADQVRLRIHVRGWQTENEHLTLAHEYIHLALRHHPRGRDEKFVEQLARRLTGSGQ